MSKSFLWVCFPVFLLVGCVAEICQDDVKFDGRTYSEIHGFERNFRKLYKLSGALQDSYCGDGVKNNTFSPYGLSKGEHYIFYRDKNSFFKIKKIRIDIVAIDMPVVECDCDANYKVVCKNCDENGMVTASIKCGECNRKGWKRNIYCKGVKCLKCNGDGILRQKIKCTICEGTKRIDCDKH